MPSYQELIALASAPGWGRWLALGTAIGILAVILASVTNLGRARYCRQVLQQYRRWATAEGQTRVALFEKLSEERARLLQMRSMCGLPERRLPDAAPIGMGLVRTTNFDPWDAWLTNRADSFELVCADLRAMVGHFRHSALTVWHPFSWHRALGAALSRAIDVVRAKKGG